MNMPTSPELHAIKNLKQIAREEYIAPGTTVCGGVVILTSARDLESIHFCCSASLRQSRPVQRLAAPSGEGSSDCHARRRGATESSTHGKIAAQLDADVSDATARERDFDEALIGNAPGRDVRRTRVIVGST